MHKLFNGGAFFVEAVAIVGSILLAFAIDACWDDRSDKIRLAGAIQNIADEVRDAREEIVNAVERNTFRIDGIRRFLSLQADELLTLPEGSILSFRDVFYTPSPFDSSGYALQALLAGSNLEIVADVIIRADGQTRRIFSFPQRNTRLRDTRCHSIAGCFSVSASR